MATSSPDPVRAWLPDEFDGDGSPGYREVAGSGAGSDPAGRVAAEAPPPVVLAPAPVSWRGEDFAAPTGREAEALAEADRRRRLEEACRLARQEGRIEADEALVPPLAALRETLRDLTAARDQILQDVEANLTVLALAVAKKIIAREAEADHGIVRRMVSRGLELVRPDEPVTVRLNPKDLERLQDRLESLAAEEAAEVRWRGDPDIERGGVVVEGPRRIVDGRLDETLRLIYERLAYE